MSHTHTPLDVQPGTVTLCVEAGVRWWHFPVDAGLWEDAVEGLREGFREQTRRLAGEDAQLPVTVVTREDVGPFPGA
ncbi:hypothetical protein [Streptomyces sp. NPDC006355]|uniref:hypothetical protein n=1 Tax=Streptomyces sp. NPDC006355 TaxID=3156758 RepID=UPI0033BF1690